MSEFFSQYGNMIMAFIWGFAGGAWLVTWITKKTTDAAMYAVKSISYYADQAQDVMERQYNVIVKQRKLIEDYSDKCDELIKELKG